MQCIPCDTNFFSGYIHKSEDLAVNKPTNTCTKICLHEQQQQHATQTASDIVSRQILNMYIIVCIYSYKYLHIIQCLCVQILQAAVDTGSQLILVAVCLCGVDYSHMSVNASGCLVDITKRYKKHIWVHLVDRFNSKASGREEKNMQRILHVVWMICQIHTTSLPWIAGSRVAMVHYGHVSRLMSRCQPGKIPKKPRHISCCSGVMPATEESSLNSCPRNHQGWGVNSVNPAQMIVI